MNLRQAFNREFRRQMGSRGRAERYAKKGDQGSFGWAKKDDQKQFRWITLNGGSGPDGHGGTPVLIDAKGTIQGGPKALEGKSLGKLGNGNAGTSRDTRKGNSPGPTRLGDDYLPDNARTPEKIHAEIGGLKGPEYGKALRSLSREEARNYLDWKNAKDRREAASRRGKKAAKTRKRREEQKAERAANPYGSRTMAAQKELDRLGQLLQSGVDVEERRWQVASEELEKASYDERLYNDWQKRSTDVVNRNRNREKPSLGSQDNKQATTAHREPGTIPWSVSFMGDEPQIITGARLEDTYEGDRRVRLYGLGDVGKTRGALYIHFPPGNQEANKRARQLVWAIANGRAEDATHDDLTSFVKTGERESSRTGIAEQFSRAFRRSVRRYEKPTGGRWVTLNGDGEGSGSKVFIKDGMIEKGPKSLTGKPINSVDKRKAGTSKDKRKKNTPPRPDWMKKQPSPDLPKDDDGNFTLRRDKATPDFTPPKSKARDLFGDEPPLSPTDGTDMLPGASKPLTPVHREPTGIVTGAAQMHFSDLRVDPKRFQYKFEGVGDDGVTDELKGVKKYNPMLGGQILVWRDPNDGHSYVVNGHHRHELARRSGEHDNWDGKMPVYYVDAQSPKEARALGALANIAEGRGTAVDAAKFLRDSGLNAEELFDQHGISLKGAIARDGQTLTKLSDPLFQKLAEGMMSGGRAIAIASELSDHGKQAELMGQIEKSEAKRNKDLPDAAVREMAKMMDLASTSSQQGGLFDDFAERSSFVERAELMASLRRTLSSDRNTFRQASSTRRQSALESTGTNTLDVEGNRERAQAADVALFDFDARANAKGDEIATAISDAAEELADAPRKRKSIEKRLTQRIRELLGDVQSGGSRSHGESAERHARPRRHRQPGRYARDLRRELKVRLSSLVTG